MKTVRLQSIGDVRLQEEARSVPGAGESLVRVTAVGPCGPYLNGFSEGAIVPAQLGHPPVLRHEFAEVTAPGQQNIGIVNLCPPQPALITTLEVAS